MGRRAFIPAVLAMLALGCEEDFQPKGKFQQALVVYSVLTPDADSVFVRLHAAYDPPSFNPFEHTSEPSLTGAVVTLTYDSGTVVLNDSTVAHPDSSRYGSSMRIFYGTPISIVRGRPYTLRATVPGYPTATAVTTVPGNPTVSILNAFALSTPRLFDTQDVIVIVRPPPEAKGFLPRLFVEYEVQTPSPREERMEVPYDVETVDQSASFEYPRLTPIEQFGTPSNTTSAMYAFRGTSYQYVIRSITGTYGITNVHFKQVKLYVNLIDEPLYNYYFIVNGFLDPYTIRTDRPDYSNVLGGVGVFGSFTLDSIGVDLPSYLNN